MKLPAAGDCGPGSAHELRAESVSYRTSGRLILNRVSLAACRGEALALIGPSGSGKTTLLLILAGLLEPSQGGVLLDGRPLEGARSEVRGRFGVVFQGPTLVPVLTAAENIALPLQARGLPRDDVRRRTEAALAEVRLTVAADHMAEELSGGQQQRVAVARALAARPDLVLADEPTSEVDTENRALVMGLLLAVARSGRVVVIASHDPEVAGACDRRVQIVDGRIAG